MPDFPVKCQLLKPAQTHMHLISDAIQPSHPVSSPSPAFNLSQHQGIFSWVSSLHQVAKVLEFQLHISPSNEYSELISIRIGWFDLLAVQRTLKSLLQHYSSKASILRCSAFFIVQLSHSYMTTGKTIALTRWTFVCKVMSLFFFSPIIFISWSLITLQYYSGFCHTLTWISHGFTCVPHSAFWYLF